MKNIKILERSQGNKLSVLFSESFKIFQNRLPQSQIILQINDLR
jgi:hypothetical protein